MVAVAWAVDARRDLRDIQRFIARDSPTAARALVRQLKRATARLSRHPRIGRQVPEFSDARTRELLVGNYRLVYRVFDDRVTVVAVWHAKRDLVKAARERGWIQN